MNKHTNKTRFWVRSPKTTQFQTVKRICILILAIFTIGVICYAQQYAVRPSKAIGGVATISSISTSFGPTAGNNSIEITGTNFWSAPDTPAITAVRFGEVPAFDFTVNSDTSITAIAPPNVYGTVNITLTTTGDNTTLPTVSYTYNVSPPKIDSLNPDSGLTDGGDAVQITGKNFYRDFVKISAESLNTFAIDSFGDLYAWGANTSGQIGNGGVSSTDVTTPWKVNGSGAIDQNAKIVEVSNGYENYTMAIDSTGTLYAWGQDNYNQLGNGSGTSNVTSPWKVNGSGAILESTKIIDVSAGFGHTLALDDEGNVYAWGHNTSGQVGDGAPTTNVSLPWKVNGGGGAITANTKILTIAAGHRHSMAIDADGNLYMWGENVYGQLGDGTRTMSKYPKIVNGAIGSLITADTNIVAISGRFSHSMAIDSDGNAYAWGGDSYGQIGNGDDGNAHVLLPWKLNGVGDIDVDAKIVAVAASSNHSLALDSTGVMYAWGRNSFGQVGNNDTTGANVDLPSRVNGKGGSITDDTKIISIAGFNTSLALDSDGYLHIWGRNEDGQVGNGTTSATGVFLPWKLGKLPNVSVTNIAFGEIDATSFTINSDTSATAITPAHEAEIVNLKTTAIDNVKTSLSNSQFTFYDAPDPPVLTVRANHNKIYLSWTTPDDNNSPITSYTLQRSTRADFSVPAEIVEVYSGTDTNFTDTDIALGVTYYYRVCAQNSAGFSGSNTVNGATPQLSPPDTGLVKNKF